MFRVGTEPRVQEEKFPRGQRKKTFPSETQVNIIVIMYYRRGFDISGRNHFKLVK